MITWIMSGRRVLRAGLLVALLASCSASIDGGDDQAPPRETGSAPQATPAPSPGSPATAGPSPTTTPTGTPPPASQPTPTPPSSTAPPPPPASTPPMGAMPLPPPAPPSPAAAANFQARCAAPGVLLCRGFDDDAELAPSPSKYKTGGEPNWQGSYQYMIIDKAIRASGNGSLRFEIRGKTPASHSGAFRQIMPKAFGEGTTFYAQFRLRLSPEFISTPWDKVVSSAPKIVLFHHASATCNDVEWAQVMSGWYGHIASMYTHCGMFGTSTTLDGSRYTSAPPSLMQQGDYRCAYGAKYATDPNCLKYTPDKWMTFYFRATIGHWKKPDSTLESWISVDGGPYKQWLKVPFFTIYADGESLAGFNSVYLTTYMTRKDAAADHPTAYAWYDELIVSTNPIAVPAASP